MKVAALLSWFDESPGWLATAVSGFARFCDVVVCVDGAYSLYPGARARSRPDQMEACQLACEAAGVAFVGYQPSEPFWGNEVEKRNLTLKLAAPFLEPGRDWVAVVDADCHVMQANPEVIRHELENTDCLVASYTVLDGMDVMSMPMAAHAAKVDVSTEWTIRVRDIFRWTDDLRYERTHWVVRGTYQGEDVYVKGPELVPAGERWQDPVACLELNEQLVVHHRTSHRAKVRNEAREQYYRNRDLAGIERLDKATA